MNFNIFPMLLNIQENTSSILDGVPSLVETEQISMWQLIWGYDSVSGEYSLTSLIVMSLLFLFSFIAIYVFIERFMTIQRALKGEKDFIKKINDFVLKGNLIEAKEHLQLLVFFSLTIFLLKFITAISNFNLAKHFLFKDYFRKISFINS